MYQKTKDFASLPDGAYPGICEKDAAIIHIKDKRIQRIILPNKLHYSNEWHGDLHEKQVEVLVPVKKEVIADDNIHAMIKRIKSNWGLAYTLDTWEKDLVISMYQILQARKDISVLANKIYKALPDDMPNVQAVALSKTLAEVIG